MLASIRRVRDHAEVVVQPALVSVTHMLADIGGVYNAVMVHGDLTGQTLYYGKGAGRYPTGAAILGDLADAANRLRSAGPWNTSGFMPGEGRIRIQDPDAVLSRRYLRLTLADRPGILSQVTQILGEQKISLAAVLQREIETVGRVPVILLTHPAPGRAIKAALKEIDGLDGVLTPTVMFRIEDAGPGSGSTPRKRSRAVAAPGDPGV
jgi:homoserine dehydrogenase